MPGVQVLWIPSQKSEEEFTRAGLPRHAWAGNNVADQAAMLRARVGLVPDDIAERVQRLRCRSVEVAHVVASVRLPRLQQRLRTESGGTVKAAQAPCAGRPAEVARAECETDLPAQGGSSAAAPPGSLDARHQGQRVSGGGGQADGGSGGVAWLS